MSESSEFKIPKDGMTYCKRVFDRCNDLIDTGIWQGIEKERLDSWINNFHSFEEKYFAAVILDSLIYRSLPQTKALMKQLFQRTLPDVIRIEDARFGLKTDWLQLLSNKATDPLIRIVPVINESSLTESGPYIGRLLRRHFIANKWVIPPNQIADALDSGVKIILFVDDFLGTGRQFQGFAKRINVLQICSKAYCLFAPLVAHEKGVNRLKKTFSNLHLACVEVLRSSHCLFSAKSIFFNDGTNSAKCAKQFYEKMLKDRNLLAPRKRIFGYGRLGLSFAFQHSTPNSSLPILWLQNNRWNSLLDR